MKASQLKLKENEPKLEPFEFQNWPIYKKGISFAKNAHSLCEYLPKEGSRSLIDQLRRASQSIPLNVAEGCSRYSKKDKGHFFRIAKGSVFECVAIMDMMKEFEWIKSEQSEKLKTDLTELGKMLSGLIGWLGRRED